MTVQFAALAAVVLATSPALAAGDDSHSAVPSHQNHPVDPAVPTPTGAMVDLGAAGGKAYLARPTGDPKGTLLVVHEWWGLNDYIKATADHYASLGYLVLAIDLYRGTVAKTPKEAGDAMGALKDDDAAKIEKAGVDYLRAQAPRARTGVIGWCMGGGQALQTALHSPDAVSAIVMYYGAPVDDVAQLKALHAPLLGLWGKKDGWITPDKVAAFDTALTSAGVKHEFHSYDADHAFANPTGGRYNPAVAKEANMLAEAFLAASLR
jgi:carboxymethylenebutenolidase